MMFITVEGVSLFSPWVGWCECKARPAFTLYSLWGGLWTEGQMGPKKRTIIKKSVCIIINMLIMLWGERGVVCCWLYYWSFVFSVLLFVLLCLHQGLQVKESSSCFRLFRTAAGLTFDLYVTASCRPFLLNLKQRSEWRESRINEGACLECSRRLQAHVGFYSPITISCLKIEALSFNRYDSMFYWVF